MNYAPYAMSMRVGGRVANNCAYFLRLRAALPEAANFAQLSSPANTRDLPVCVGHSAKPHQVCRAIRDMQVVVEKVVAADTLGAITCDRGSLWHAGLWGRACVVDDQDERLRAALLEALKVSKGLTAMFASFFLTIMEVENWPSERMAVFQNPPGSFNDRWVTACAP